MIHPAPYRWHVERHFLGSAMFQEARGAPARDPLSALLTIAWHVEEGSRPEASRLLERLLSQLDGTRTEDQLVEAIATALRKRAEGVLTDAGSLYAEQDAFEHMRLFTLMRERLPGISMAYPLANALLLPHVAGQERVVLFDIGIGYGEQLADLIHLCGTRGGAPRRLVVVGLDLNAEALANARRRVLSAAAAWNIDATFISLGKAVEALTEADWALLEGLEGTRVVNATFALHHLSYVRGGRDVRQRLLERLHQWKPRTLVFSEPDADLNDVPLPERTRNAYDFFLGFFRHIDTLDIPARDKHLLKVNMLARELEDILGPQEDGRSERYESGHSWRTRLEQAGFALTPPPPSFTQASTGRVTVDVDPGYVSLRVEGISLLCLLRAEPVAS